tara:strand:+ start:197 stop:496 length:300 start_codon:yes stop_codon:yes gene_type:complete
MDKKFKPSKVCFSVDGQIRFYTRKQLSKIINMVLELGYDYDRMSESGQITFDKIMVDLGFMKKGDQYYDDVTIQKEIIAVMKADDCSRTEAIKTLMERL